MTLEDVKTSLDINPNLSDEMKAMFLWLSTTFNKQYPDINLSNLCDNLKTLSFEKSNKFVEKKMYQYDIIENKLKFNKELIEDGYDMRNVMMCALLNVITNNGKMTGFNLDDKYRAANAGYTKMLADNLVGYEGEKPYLEYEYIAANEVSYLVGTDVMYKAYFNNDADYLIDQVLKKGFGSDGSNKQI